MAETTELLRKLSRTSGSSSGSQSFDDGEEAKESCYGWLRGRHERAEMLEFRFRSGRYFSLAYSCLYSVDFDPPIGITLNFGEILVLLQGRSLAHIAESAKRHRLVWIEEVDPVRDLSAESAPAVTKISLHKAVEESS